MRPDIDSLGNIGDPLRRVLSRAWDGFERRGPADVSPETSPADQLCDLIGLGVPRVLAAVLVDEALQPSAAVDALRECHRDTLVLAGHEGSGRSQAAAVWIFEGESPSIFAFAHELVRLRNDSPHDRRRWKACVSARVLAVDDVGLEDRPARSKALLGELLARRVGAGLRTVLTTPLSGPRFKARYGDEVWDQITSKGRFHELTERWHGGEGLEADAV